MSEEISLQDLAERVAPEQCAVRGEAVAVQDGDLEPPSSWNPEIEERVQNFIKSESKRRLSEFDENDLLIAQTFCDVERTGVAIEQWNKELAETPDDWKKRIEAARSTHREKYERDTRKTLPSHARRVIIWQVAEAKAQAAATEVIAAVRAAMTAPGVAVWAIPHGGERRQIGRAELLAMEIAFEPNELKLDGRRWQYVDVMLPVTSHAVQPVAATARTPRTPSRSKQLAAYLVSRGSEYIESRTRTEIADDFKKNLDLRAPLSVSTVDRAKKEAFRTLASASNLAK